jgi:hypothetical protein
MKKLILICVVVGLTLVITAEPANAAMTVGVLTFDDLPNPGGGIPIPNGYGGGNWSNMYYLKSSALPPNSGYQNGMVSSPNVAYNAFANPALVTDGTFDFKGAYLTAAWRDGLNIKVEGYLGATQLYTQTVVVNHTGPTWFAFNYSGIDTLKFSSWGGTEVPNLGGSGAHFAMDNFTVVPAPGAVLLGGIGAGLVGWLRRRRTL